MNAGAASAINGSLGALGAFKLTPLMKMFLVPGASLTGGTLQIAELAYTFKKGAARCKYARGQLARWRQTQPKKPFVTQKKIDKQIELWAMRAQRDCAAVQADAALADEAGVEGLENLAPIAPVASASLLPWALGGTTVLIAAALAILFLRRRRR